MKFLVAFLAGAAASAVGPAVLPPNFSPANFHEFKSFLKDGLLKAVNHRRKLQSDDGGEGSENTDDDEGLGSFKALCTQYGEVFVGNILEQSFASQLPAGSPAIDGATAASCLCSDAITEEVLNSFSTDSADIAPLCTDNCKGLLELFLGAFASSIAASSPTALPATFADDFVGCLCSAPTLLSSLSGDQGGDSSDDNGLAVACTLCNNAQCQSLIAATDPTGAGCSQIPAGYCSTSSSPPPPITVSMTASGSVSDYTDSVKSSIAASFAATFSSNFELPLNETDVTVTVTPASGRRLAQVESATRRLQSSGVNIDLDFAPPAGVSSSFIANQMQSPAAKSAIQTAVSAVPGVTVTGVTGVSAPPEPTPAGAGGESDPESSDPCFPSSATVTMAADGRAVRLAELKEGDEIEAVNEEGSRTRSTVSLLSIAKPEAKAMFHTLTTQSGHQLNLTAEHHLPVGDACCSELKQAKDLRVGEKVWAVEKTGALVARTVSKLATHVPLGGLHSPVLANGAHPIVDGFVTAFDGIRSVRAASYGLSPLLSACKATGTCTHLKGLHAYLNGRDAVADYIGF